MSWLSVKWASLFKLVKASQDGNPLNLEALKSRALSSSQLVAEILGQGTTLH